MATHPRCTTQKGLSHSKYVCVTIKLFVGVCVWTINVISRSAVCFWTYLSIADHFETTLVSVLAYYQKSLLLWFTQTTHSTLFMRKRIFSYTSKKNIVFPAKENKTLTRIQETQSSFLAASHVSPVVFLRVFYHVYSTVHRFRIIKELHAIVIWYNSNDV